MQSVRMLNIRQYTMHRSRNVARCRQFYFNFLLAYSRSAVVFGELNMTLIPNGGNRFTSR